MNSWELGDNDFLTLRETLLVCVLTLLSVSTNAEKDMVLPLTKELWSFTVQSRPISKHCSLPSFSLSSGICTLGPKKKLTTVPFRVIFSEESRSGKWNLVCY